MEKFPKLEAFLRSLSDNEADELWEYLDGNMNCVFDMCDLLLESHPSIAYIPNND